MISFVQFHPSLGISQCQRFCEACGLFLLQVVVVNGPNRFPEHRVRFRIQLLPKQVSPTKDLHQRSGLIIEIVVMLREVDAGQMIGSEFGHQHIDQTVLQHVHGYSIVGALVVFVLEEIRVQMFQRKLPIGSISRVFETPGFVARLIA